MVVNGGNGGGVAGSKQHFWPASIPPSLNRKDRQILAHAGFNFTNNNNNNNSNVGSSQRSPKRQYQNQNNNNGSNNNNGNVIQSTRFPIDFDARFSAHGNGTQQTSVAADNNNNNGKYQYLNMSSRNNDPWKMMKNHQNQINKNSCQLDKTNIFAVLKKQMSCPFVEASPPIQLFKEEDRNRLNALYSGARGLSVISSPAPLQTREDSSTAAVLDGSGDNGKGLISNNTSLQEGEEGGPAGEAAATQSQSTDYRG